MKRIILSVLFLFAFGLASAQNYTDSDPFGDNTEEIDKEETPTTDPNYDWSWKTSGIPTAPPPPPVPIDGGASLLLILGTGFGLSKLRFKRKS